MNNSGGSGGVAVAPIGSSFGSGDDPNEEHPDSWKAKDLDGLPPAGVGDTQDAGDGDGYVDWEAEETDEDWVPFAYGRKRIVMSNNMYSYPLGGALCFDDKHQLFVYKHMYHDASSLRYLGRVHR